jgi:hypothetical protein
MSQFRVWDIVYIVLLGLGLACIAFGLIMQFGRRSRVVRLRGLNLDISAADAEDSASPLGTVYLSPHSGVSAETLEKPATTIKTVLAVGGGLTVGALFGAVTRVVFGWSPISQLVGAAAVGLGALAAMSFVLGLGRVSRPEGEAPSTSFRGARGKVTTPIPVDSFGQIVVVMDGKTRVFSARAHDLSGVPRETVVEVLDVVGDLAVVRPVKPGEP